MIDRTPLRTLTFMWLIVILGFGLGGVIGTLLKWGWPLSALGWVMVKGQAVGSMIGAGLGYGALVAFKMARKRPQGGTPGARIARSRSNKLLMIIPLTAAVLIVVLALVQWYWFFERIDVDDIIEVLESNGFTTVAIEPTPTPAFDGTGQRVTLERDGSRGHLFVYSYDQRPRLYPYQDTERANVIHVGGSIVGYPGEAEPLVIRNVVVVIASDDLLFLDRARWFLKSGFGQQP